MATVSAGTRRGYVRWGICALLFFAVTINYIDRQVIGILKPTLQAEFGWSEIDYGDIVFAFQVAYAIGFALAGRMIDWLGARRGYAIAIVIWSLAALAHAEATTFGPGAAAILSLAGLTYSASVAGFMAARFALGFGESGNFPAAIKVVAEWFPARERALATGLFNSGANIGAILTPLIVPWITLSFGWYWAFIATGMLGFAWLAAWWLTYAPPEGSARVGAVELAYIRSDPPGPGTKVPWRRLLAYHQTWAFVIAKFLTDPIWWLYLYWIPDFLHRNHGIDLTTIGPPLVVIYLVSDVGSIGGGWLSSALIARGWSVNAGRKMAMLICALAVTPIAAASGARDLWIAVSLVALAAAAHQGWSANLFTLASDIFPRQVVGSIVGLGGTAAAIGGMLLAKLTGAVLEFTGSYLPVFLIAASAYLVSLAVIHVMMPRLEPVRM
jgi:ACS family hexuronate transporter-like MFS transporter